MSCAVFTILGLVVAWFNKDNAWTVRGIFTVSGVLLFVAGFLAWLDEHEALGVERSKNAFPEIRGEISIAFWEHYKNPYYGQTVTVDSQYYLKISLTNFRDVPCTIDRYLLLIHSGEAIEQSENGDDRLNGRIEHDSNFLDNSTETNLPGTSKTGVTQMMVHSGNPLKRACAQSGWVGFRVRNYVPRDRDNGCWQEIFTLLVIDSLGKTHEIDGPLTSTCVGHLSE
jgi:hypothetical protein